MGKKIEGAKNLISQLERFVDFTKPLKDQIDQKFTVYKGVVVRRDSWRGRLAKIFDTSEKEDVKVLKTEKLFADAVVYLGKRKPQDLERHKKEYAALVSDVIPPEAGDFPETSLQLQTNVTTSALNLILQLESVVDFTQIQKQINQEDNPIQKKINQEDKKAEEEKQPAIDEPLEQRVNTKLIEQINEKFTVYKGKVVERNSWKGRLSKWFDSTESEQIKIVKTQKLFADAIIYLAKKNPQALQNHEGEYRFLLANVFHWDEMKKEELEKLEKSLPVTIKKLNELITPSPELKSLEQQRKEKEALEQTEFAKRINNSLLRRVKDEKPASPMEIKELELFFGDQALDEKFLDRLDAFVAQHHEFRTDNYNALRQRISNAINDDGQIAKMLESFDTDQTRHEFLLKIAEEMREDIVGMDKSEKQLYHFGYGSKKNTVSDFFEGSKPLLAYLRKLPPSVTEGLPEPIMSLIGSPTRKEVDKQLKEKITRPLIKELIEQARALVDRITDEKDKVSIFFTDPNYNLPSALNMFLPGIVENFIKDGFLLNISELVKNPDQRSVLVWLAKNGHQLLHKKVEHDKLFEEIEENLFHMLEEKMGVLQNALDKSIQDMAKHAGGVLPKEVLALFGIDASLITGPLWLEFEKKENGTFTVNIYTLGATLNNHSSLVDEPNKRHTVLKIEDIQGENISEEFFYRLLLKRYEPLWNSEATSLGHHVYSKDLPLLGGKIVQPNENTPYALLSQPATPANLAAGQLLKTDANPADPLFEFKLDALVRFCKQYVDPKTDKLEFPDYAHAQTALKAAKKLEASMKKMSMKPDVLATLEEIKSVAGGVKEIYPNPVDNLKLQGALKIEEKLHDALGVTFDQLDSISRTTAWAIGGDEGDLLNKVADEIKTRFPTEVRNKARGGIPLNPSNGNKGTFKGVSLVYYLNIAWKIALVALGIAGASMGGAWILLGAPVILALLPYVLPKPAYDWYIETLENCLHQISRFMAKCILFIGLDKKKRHAIYELREEAINWLQGGRFATKEHAEQMYLIPQDKPSAKEKKLELAAEKVAEKVAEKQASEPEVEPVDEVVDIPLEKKEKIIGLEEISGFCPLKSMICHGKSGKIVSIEMPEQHLNFDIIDSEGGSLALSKEYLGFHIAKSQNDHRLGGLPGCLILESETGERKVLIKRNQWIYSALGNATAELGDLGQYISRRLAVIYGGTSTKFYEYEIPADPKAPLKTEEPEALTYLMIHAMLQSNTKMAEGICSRIESLLSREPISETMLEQIFPLLAYPGISPELILIRTRIFAALGENLSIHGTFPSDKAFNPLMSTLILVTSLQDLKTQSKAPNPSERLSLQQEYFLYKFTSHMMKLTMDQLKMTQGFYGLLHDNISFELLVDSPLMWNSPIGKRYRALQKEFEIPTTKSSAAMRFISRFKEAPGGLSWFDFNLVPETKKVPVVPRTSDQETESSKINKLLTIPMLAQPMLSQSASDEFGPLIAVGPLRKAMAWELRGDVPLDILSLTPEALRENFATYYALMTEHDFLEEDEYAQNEMVKKPEMVARKDRLIHTLQVKEGSGDKTTQQLQNLLLAIAKDPSRYPHVDELLNAQHDKKIWKEFFRTLERIDAFERLCTDNLLPLVFETLLGLSHGVSQAGFAGSGEFYPELRIARVIAANETFKTIPGVAAKLSKLTAHLITDETNTDFSPFLKALSKDTIKHKGMAMGAAAATVMGVAATSLYTGLFLRSITESVRGAINLVGAGNVIGIFGGLKVAQMRDTSVMLVRAFNPFHMLVPHVFDSAGRLVYMFSTEDEIPPVAAQTDLPPLDLTELKKTDDQLQDLLNEIFNPLEKVKVKGKEVYHLKDEEESIKKIRNDLRTVRDALDTTIKAEIKSLEEILKLPIHDIMYYNEKNPETLFPLLPKQTEEDKISLRLALLGLNQKQLRLNMITTMIDVTGRLKDCRADERSPIIQELAELFTQESALKKSSNGNQELTKKMHYLTETGLTLDAATDNRISTNLAHGNVSRAGGKDELEPLIAATKADGKALAISIFTNENPSAQMQELSRKLRDIFGIDSYSPRFDREKPLSIQKLESIYVLFRGISKSGDCLQLTEEDLLNLRAMFLQRISHYVDKTKTRNPDADIELKYLHKILKFIYQNGAPVIDENAVSHPTTSLPLNLDEPGKVVRKGNLLIARSVIEKIMKHPDIETEIENMRKGDLTEIPTLHYEKRIKPDLVAWSTEKCAEKFGLKSKQKAVVSDLISGKTSEFPKWLKNNTKLYETVAIHRSCILNFPSLANRPPAELEDQGISPLERFLRAMVHAKINEEEIQKDPETFLYNTKNIPSNTLDLAGMFEKKPALTASAAERITQAPRQLIYEKILACKSENIDDWCSVFTKEGSVLVESNDPLLFEMESNDPYELQRFYTQKFAKWNDTDRDMLEDRLKAALK